ncbi:hypothetical protein HK44_020910 [Pseudomonas fluorescens HK44]|uniref:Uncharacterized protein n=1 Tax=Pseudomonas fluorescens HK44 TaxID=1042209 RepID=A0A010TGW1_PSEFL|nr:hypothetical protein HK44_020910 [Pseudomonas fluorescens HK44]
MCSSAEHLRMQRDERRLKSHGFLMMQPNPFVDEVGIEAVAQGDVCDGGAGLGALLDDLGFERFTVGTALRMHGKSA